MVDEVVETPEEKAMKEKMKKEQKELKLTPMMIEAQKERRLMDEANTRKEELLDREEKLAANSMLSGTVGGSIEPQEVISPARQRVLQAAKEFEGTQLEKDILRANKDVL